MSEFFPRDRSYSSAPSTHNVALTYGFSPTYVQTGGANPVTGNFIPITANPDGSLAVTIAGLQFTGVLNADIDAVGITGGYVGITGQYTLATPLLITGSQVQIPASVQSYSISIISGFGFVNGVGPLYSYTNINGGGYGGSKSTAAINVGCTGSAASPSQVLVIWET